MKKLIALVLFLGLIVPMGVSASESGHISQVSNTANSITLQIESNPNMEGLGRMTDYVLSVDGVVVKEEHGLYTFAKQVTITGLEAESQYTVSIEADTTGTPYFFSDNDVMYTLGGEGEEDLTAEEEADDITPPAPTIVGSTSEPATGATYEDGYTTDALYWIKRGTWSYDSWSGYMKSGPIYWTNKNTWWIGVKAPFESYKPYQSVAYIEVQIWEDDGRYGDDHVGTWILGPQWYEQGIYVNASKWKDGTYAEFYTKMYVNYNVSGRYAKVSHWEY